jgi:hypothetical protein
MRFHVTYRGKESNRPYKMVYSFRISPFDETPHLECDCPPTAIAAEFERHCEELKRIGGMTVEAEDSERSLSWKRSIVDLALAKVAKP